MYHLLYQPVYLDFSMACIYGFHTILKRNKKIFLNNINQLIFVLGKSYVFFLARTEFFFVI
jgi:hypothetical protein